MAKGFVAAALVLTLAACGTAGPTANPPDTAPDTAPDTGAAEAAVRAYIDTVRDGDWRAAAALMDPAELDEMGELVQLMLSVSGPPPGVEAPPDDGPGVFAWFMEFVVGSSPMVAEAFTEADGEILGTVVEADSLAHVVMRTRTRVMGIEAEKMGTTTVRRTDAGWVVALNGDLRAYIDAMRWMGEDPDRFELDPDLEDGDLEDEPLEDEPIDEPDDEPGRNG